MNAGATHIMHAESLANMVPLDFVIVGAMKAGTTTLYQYLQRHPRIFLPERKDPMFFSRDVMFARGFDWYRGLFDGAGEDQIRGEASTCYSRYPVYPKAAERLAQYVPNAKLLYILRHPVDRLYSHYVHVMTVRLVRSEGAILTFEQFAEEDEEALCAGRYLFQIEHLRKHFDASQIHVVLFDDLCDDPGPLLDGVQQFLGVEPANLLDRGPVRANAAAARTSHVATHHFSYRWTKRLRSAPGIRHLAAAVPHGWRRRARTTVEQALAKSGLGRRRVARFHRELFPPSAETRQTLCERFADDVYAVGDYLNRDLRHWLQ